MKNFDTLFVDVRENAKATAAAISQQATKIYDASKHRISAETIKRSIAKKLIDLGKLTYKATTQDVDLSEEIAKVVEEITELKQNLAIVDAHLAAIMNQKICPDCQAKVTVESVFCNICGHKFEEEPVEEEEAAEEVAEETAEEAAEEAAGEVTEEPAAEAVETAPAAVADGADEIVAAAKEAVEEISEDAAEVLEKAEAEVVEAKAKAKGKAKAKK